MLLEHRFSVPAPLERVWAAVTDPERVAPCMPGATLTEVGEAGFSGSVKVKLGPISLLYKGSGQFLETDEQARRVVIKASGKDSRGNGTAAATVTLTLSADGDTSTMGTVVTDLTVTGKPAQLGRGMIVEVGGKILDTFAACLGTTLSGPTPTPSAATPQPAPSEPAPSEPAQSQPAQSQPAQSQPAAAQPAEDAEPEPQAPPKPATRRRAGTKSTAAAVNSTASAGAKPAPEEPAAPESASEEPAPAAPTVNAADTDAAGAPRLQLVDAPPARPETDAIDLLDYAGPSIAKRLIPAVLGLLVLILLIRRLRRR